jgi:hypothetical protein
MKRTTSPVTAGNPVELLRDGRGIYGIGVSEAFDVDALAWTCGIDPETWQTAYVPNLIVRPDMLQFSKPCSSRFAVLQKITGGFRYGMFRNSHEEQLRRFIHHEALNRAGLPWPPSPHSPPPEREIQYWSSDKKRQDRNRQIYHGLRRRSLAVINQLIGLALQEAADLDALKMARRFALIRLLIGHRAARARLVNNLTDRLGRNGLRPSALSDFTFAISSSICFIFRIRIRSYIDLRIWGSGVRISSGAPATRACEFPQLASNSIEHFPYTARRRWHLDVAQTSTAMESVDDSVDDRRRSADSAGLTRALDAQWVGRRRHVMG